MIVPLEINKILESDVGLAKCNITQCNLCQNIFSQLSTRWSFNLIDSPFSIFAMTLLSYYECHHDSNSVLLHYTNVYIFQIFLANVNPSSISRFRYHFEKEFSLVNLRRKLTFSIFMLYYAYSLELNMIK